MATDRPDTLIDDFNSLWSDWYRLEPQHPFEWEYSTRKLSDPKWQGKTGQRLAIEVESMQPNDLVVVVTENCFRSYRGAMQEYIAIVHLNGGSKVESLSLTLKDFQNLRGESLSSWENIDLLSFRAYYEQDGKLFGKRTWAGNQPVFLKLQWLD